MTASSSPSLVIQTSFLGDMVLTTPLLERLARDGPVDVLATPAAGALLANHPAVRDIIPYDKHRNDSGTVGFVRISRQLRRTGYARAFHAQGSVRSASLAAISGIPRRTGFETSAGRRFYTNLAPYVQQAHHAERLLALADPARAEALAGTRPRPTLFPGEAELAEVETLLSKYAIGLGQPLIGIAPASVWGTKQWPGYGELAALLGAMGQVVIVGGAVDRELAAAIVSESTRVAPGLRVAAPVDATGELSLLGSAELIGRMRVLITNDSAPLHLASAMNTPTVAVFGPTVPGFGFGPLADRSVVIEVDALSCRPCDRHGPRECPLGHWRCMREISAIQIADHVRDLITPD